MEGYLNKYMCPSCKAGWDDINPEVVDADCWKCGKSVSPCDSDGLTEGVVQEDGEGEPKTLFKDSYGYEAEVDHSADDEAPVGCGSCAWHGRYDQTVAIGLCSLTPGDPSPSGRCPECDSLCYLDAVEEKNKVA